MTEHDSDSETGHERPAVQDVSYDVAPELLE